MRSKTFVSAVVLAALCAAPSAEAQSGQGSSLPANVVVPQRGSLATAQGAARVALSRVDVDVRIEDRVATTTLYVGLHNPQRSAVEVELMLPVPAGATVSDFDFTGRAPESTATLLPAAQARTRYEEVVRRARDPALLEFADFDTVRTSVFPVQAGANQTVKLVYTHVLESAGDRVDYVLPRSESLASAAVPWSVHVRLRAAGPIAALHSPSHAFQRRRGAAGECLLSLAEDAARAPGPIQFSWVVHTGLAGGSVIAHPDPRVGGGYFMLLAGAPPREAEAARVPREVVVVLDRSGSMRGPKMEQARQAALRVLEALQPGDAFNLLSFSNDVIAFAKEPVAVDRQSLQDASRHLLHLNAGGGTDIDEALARALAQPRGEGRHSIVLFLTDGLPTDGVLDEAEIRKRAQERNRAEWAVFTFGVGDDVNAPLLDHVALESRGRSTYVRPHEDVSRRVDEVHRRLTGPVLEAPSLRVLAADGSDAADRVADVEPSRLSDLYDGEPLLVFGTYQGDEPLTLEIRGRHRGEEVTTSVVFRPQEAAGKNGAGAAFVPRLWAARKVASLLDRMRLSGEDPRRALAAPEEDSLAREVYRLSTEHGILTEYTAFLAREGTDLTQEVANLDRVRQRLRDDLRRQRTGAGAVRQAMNTERLRNQERQNRANARLDESFREVTERDVLQLHARTFYRRDGLWVDSRLLRRPIGQAPDGTLALDSPRARLLLANELAGNPNALYTLGAPVLIEAAGKAIRIEAAP